MSTAVADTGYRFDHPTMGSTTRPNASRRRSVSANTQYVTPVSSIETSHNRRLSATLRALRGIATRQARPVNSKRPEGP